MGSVPTLLLPLAKWIAAASNSNFFLTLLEPRQRWFGVLLTIANGKSATSLLEKLGYLLHPQQTVQFTKDFTPPTKLFTQIWREILDLRASNGKLLPKKITTREPEKISLLC